MSLENLQTAAPSELVEPMSENSAIAAQTPEHLDAEDVERADSATSEAATPAAPMKMFKEMFRRKGKNDNRNAGSQSKSNSGMKVAAGNNKEDDDKKKKKKDDEDKKKKKPDPKRLA